MTHFLGRDFDYIFLKISLENFTSLHKNVLSLRLAGEYWWLFGASRRFGAKSGVRAGGDRR